MPIDTIFLDAGGVLVWPNWTRVAEALGRQGVLVEAAMLARADPHARHALDVAEIINASTDQRRGWQYFDLVLAHAGVPLSEGTKKAIAEIDEYHRRPCRGAFGAAARRSQPQGRYGLPAHSIDLRAPHRELVIRALSTCP
jgi:hypothetical protein